MAGLYIHIPFCKKKCDYCSFVSFENSLHNAEKYIKALEKEARSWIESGYLKDIDFETIYFGGGTPSLLPPSLVERLTQNIFEIFGLKSSNNLEVSFECNPESVNRPLLETLKQAGINRISLGVQDLSERGLKCLGRIHSASDALRAGRLIKETGFRELSLDIIYAIPGQDQKWLRQTLDGICSLEPTHISAYELTLEEGTRFAQLVTQKELEMVDEDSRLLLTRFLEDYLGEKGFNQYEISNFALPGHECSHNINYWRCGEYVGLGCSAVSYLNGIRYFNTGNLNRYISLIQAGRTAVKETEKLSLEARFRETFTISLRMVKGVDRDFLTHRFRIDPFDYYRDTLNRMCSLGLMRADPEQGNIRLTRKGRYIANYVLSHFV